MVGASTSAVFAEIGLVEISIRDGRHGMVEEGIGQTSSGWRSCWYAY